jgi:hypothetical protein
MNMLIRFGDDAFAIDLMMLGWALRYKLLVRWGGVGWKGALDYLSPSYVFGLGFVCS